MNETNQQPDFWIAPHYRRSAFPLVLKLEHKIEIFYDRVYHWQLDIADQIINGTKTGEKELPGVPHSGFAVLYILVFYFEMIAKYRDGYLGRGKSEEYFKQGIYHVFPELGTSSEGVASDIASTLYKLVRNGLYHSGSIGKRIILSHEPETAMKFYTLDRILFINPHKLPQALKENLNRYKLELSDSKNTNLRQKFEARFDEDANMDS